MGKRGPKPEPSNLKVLKGNPGNRPINGDEPQPQPYMAECPKWLNSEAKKVWKDLAPRLERLGLLKETDWPDFAILCLAIAQLKKAQRVLDKEGLTINLSEERDESGRVTKRGYCQQRPEVSIVHKNMEIINKVGAKFGMTPADRVGLISDKPKEQRGKMSKLLSG